MTEYRKKLIEVALPLEAINHASSKEKWIRHGHPSTLHLWWARRPLAACRAILFGQLVDDPGSVPKEFPDEAAQEKERQRLFRIIEALVKWENSNDEHVIYAARREIARSVARTHGDAPPKSNAEIDVYLADRAPPILDPFCGGGAIPLEAQRLGLRAYASDLNPVAVLITKALIEIPPRFAGLPPVNPEARAELAKGGAWNGKAAQGLAEDVRYYGRWMRDEAQQRIGYLYPREKLADGNESTVIAWLWARTVKCPNPACGAQMPLVGSFFLSTKTGKQTWIEPVIDRSDSPPRISFDIHTGTCTAARCAELKLGTGYPTPKGKKAKAVFRCIACGQGPVKGAYIDEEANAGRMGVMPLALVAEGKRGRAYRAVTDDHVSAAEEARRYLEDLVSADAIPSEPCRGTFASNAQGRRYGFRTFGDYFTSRQLVALTTFTNLVSEAWEKALVDARAADLTDDHVPLNEGGTGAQAYADAVATYLACALDRLAMSGNSLVRWNSVGEKAQHAFGRQAIPMIWDFAEPNFFAAATGSVDAAIELAANPLEFLGLSEGICKQLDTTHAINGVQAPVVCTDPPYYDNIGYADLSDFFYVWLRRCLGRTYPDLFKTLLTPKSSELVATPYRFDGDKERARRFFETGLGRVTAHIRAAHAPDYPMTMIYAYKQAETETDGDGNGVTASTGWETMLTGIVNGAFAITGTWPMRTEMKTRQVAMSANALASSVVLTCRPRSIDAPVATRRDFAAALKRELPVAIRRLQKENTAPVDLQQAAIGPGMAVFSRYAQVLEADGSRMPVRSALIEINRVLDETLAEQEGDMDPDTRFCVAWFEQYGTAERSYGEAEVWFTAKNTSFDGLQRAGVIVGGRGKVRLKRRDELDPDWDPRIDPRIADWECVQYLVRAMTAEAGGGVQEAARLVVAMGPGRAENARALAYRLFTVAGRKKWAEEALAYNILVTSWPQIQAEVIKLTAGGTAQSELAL